MTFRTREAETRSQEELKEKRKTNETRKGGVKTERYAKRNRGALKGPTVQGGDRVSKSAGRLILIASVKARR